MTDGCYTEVEIISALATASVDLGLRHQHPTLIAGYHIQPRSIGSGWSFLLFRGSGQTVQRSEVGVDRPPPPVDAPIIPSSLTVRATADCRWRPH